MPLPHLDAFPEPRPEPSRTPHLRAVPDRCLVSSHNEWDPLEEVIVGVISEATVPAWDSDLEATMPHEHEQFFREQAGKLFPQELRERAAEELDNFASTLESLGITVRRPDDTHVHRDAYSTPGWSSQGLYCAMPRDSLLVVGDDVIEAPMAWRSRYFEQFPFRHLLVEYFRSGARWSAAPRPQLVGPFHERQEPLFDAADFVRCGTDIFGQLSQVTNQLGVDWLRAHLGSEYTVHVLDVDDPHAMHIDATFMPLCPGKVLINPDRPPALGAMFDDWDVREAPRPIGSDLPRYMSSAWLSMNVFLLDERRVVVEAHETPLIEMLEAWGFDPIPLPFQHFHAFGGSFHCATLDVRRRGTLQSYF